MLEEIRRLHAALVEDFEADQQPDAFPQYILPGWDFSHSMTTASYIPANPIYQVSCYRFELVQDVGELGALAARPVSGVAVAIHVVFGIYNEAGDELLAQWTMPLVDTSSAARIVDPDFSSSLTKGSYWFAWSADSIQITIPTNGGSLFFVNTANAVEVNVGISLNVMSGTDLPDSLNISALTPGTNALGVPIVCIDVEV